MTSTPVQSSPFPRRTWTSSPPLRINTSPSARQSPKIIPSPVSPTKSIKADVFGRSSQTSQASIPLDDVALLSSSMDSGAGLPAPGTDLRYSTNSANLLPEEKSPDTYATRSLSFFDISDSSEVSGASHDGGAKISHGDERPSLLASREDSVSTVRPINVRLGSKASNLIDSQVERYISGALINPIKEDDGNEGTAGDNAQEHELATDGQKRTQPSDNAFGDFSLKQPKRFSANTNISIPASVSGDRVITTYSTMLQLMKEADQQASAPNNVNASHVTSAISPTNAQHTSRPYNSSPLNPHAQTFTPPVISSHTPKQAEQTFTSFSSPLAPRISRRVSLRPPPLKSSPHLSTFIPPAAYTPYPSAVRHSFQMPMSMPLHNRNTMISNSGWQRLNDDHQHAIPGSGPQTPGVTSDAELTLVLRRRHCTRTTQLALPSAFGEALLKESVQRHSPNFPMPARSASPVSSFDRRARTPVTPALTAELASLSFDDEELFLSLRQKYYTHLIGRMRGSRFWRRWLSARTLSRVRYVPDPLASMTWAGGGGVGAGDEAEAPDEEEMRRRWERPEVGKGEFQVVRWAWGVARGGSLGMSGSAAGEVGVFGGKAPGLVGAHNGENKHTSIVQSMAVGENADMLFPLPSTIAKGHIEIEESWAIWRIVLALTMVVISAVVMVVVWTLVGISAHSDDAGLAGSGSRVQEAFVMGLLVLAVGVVNLAAWLGISWVVM